MYAEAERSYTTPTLVFPCRWLFVCHYRLLRLFLFHFLRRRAIRTRLRRFFILFDCLRVGRFRLFLLLSSFKVKFLVFLHEVGGVIGVVDFFLFDLLLFRVILVHLIDFHTKLREHQLHDSFVGLVYFVHLFLIYLLLKVQLLFGLVCI